MVLTNCPIGAFMSRMKEGLATGGGGSAPNADTRFACNEQKKQVTGKEDCRGGVRQ